MLDQKLYDDCYKEGVELGRKFVLRCNDKNYSNEECKKEVLKMRETIELESNEPIGFAFNFIAFTKGFEHVITKWYPNL